MATSKNQIEDQQAVWNGSAGQAWVVAQSLLDQTFKPLEALLVDAVLEASASRVLDIGCGTGATTVAVARRLGSTGSCLGVDLSGPMTEAADIRAKREAVPAHFICADAQSFVFEQSAFDMIISRFGVMFFADPVQAFANLHGAAAPGAGLCCVVWRSAEENPFMTTAELAAESLLPGVSVRVTDGAGQFGFGDPNRVQHILQQSGWRNIEILPIDVPCSFPASELELYLSRLGPVGRALQTVDTDFRARVLETIRPAFTRYIHNDNVCFKAACWLLSATA